MKEFTHLHQHTEFSLLDSLGKIKDIVARSKLIGQNTIAITDHGTCGGHYNFNKVCKEQNSHPILGCEVYIVPDRTLKAIPEEELNELTKQITNEKELKVAIKKREKELKIRGSNHLVLLSKNNDGLVNIYKIVSDAAINGFYYRPRTDYNFLKENRNGIIVLSACLAGPIAECILQDDEESAYAYAARFKELFAEDFYLEIQPNKLEQQKKVNKKIIEIAKKLDIKFVATNDNHYILKEDKHTHDVLLLLKQKKTLEDVKNIQEKSDENEENEESTKDKILLFSVDDLYLKSYDEMLESFKSNEHDISDNVIQTSLETSNEIAEKCKAVLDFSKPCFPATKIPTSYNSQVEEMLKKYEYEDTIKNRKLSYFKILINEGWEERINGKIPEDKYDEYLNRLKFEFEVITSRGFTEYFLVVSEFIRWAKNNDILVGPGRGSAVGCLIAYCMKIIDLDPIPYGLFFERFLNPERSKMPDIDTDFPDTKRELVRQHIIEEYGAFNVAQVVAYSTMSVNACFRDVSRVYGLPLQITNQIAKIFDVQLEAYKDYATIEHNLKKYPELTEVYLKDPQYGKMIDEIFKIVSKMQLQMRHSSVAAAASVITEKEIYNYTSLKRTKDGLAVEWDSIMISKTNLLKIDLLGIKCLTIIEDTLKMLKKRNINLDLYDPEILKDQKTIDIFNRGETIASFQFDSKGIREMLKKMKPTNFEEIIAASALYRPGPLSSGLVEAFCTRKNNGYDVENEPEEHKPFLKLFAPFLKDTFGVIVYQEQLIYIFHKVLGLSISDADLLRRSIDELNKKQIQGYLDKIDIEKSQIKDLNVLKAAIEYLQKIIGYSFNKSHSTGYSIVSFWTMYLKAHYILEFGLATLNNRISEAQDLFKEFQKCWKEIGIIIKLVDINKSNAYFEYDEVTKSVYTGMLILKGIGESVTKKIVEKRPFSSIEEVIKSKSINKAGFNVFIKIGAFDELQENNMGYKNRKELWILIFASMYNLDLEKYINKMSEEDFFSLPKIKKKLSYNVLYQQVKNLNIEDYSNKELSSFEREYYGFSVFSHPLKEDKENKVLIKSYKEEYKSKVISIEKALSEEIEDGKELIFFGNIVAIKEHKSKNGNLLYFMTLEDGTNVANCLIWNKEYEKYKSRIKIDEQIIFVCSKSIYKEKDVSFIINSKFKDHDPILSMKCLKNIANLFKKDEIKKSY